MDKATDGEKMFTISELAARKTDAEEITGQADDIQSDEYKQAQRMVNYKMATMVEMISIAPRPSRIVDHPTDAANGQGEVQPVQMLRDDQQHPELRRAKWINAEPTLLAQMAEALRYYADSSKWTAWCIKTPEGIPTSIMIPDSNIASKSLKAYDEWSKR